MATDPTPTTDPTSATDLTATTDLAAALAEITGAMLALPDLEELLTRLAEVAAATVSTGSWCGITVSDGGRAFTVATSDPRAQRVDELQYARGDGPCLQSLRTGEVVSVPDMAAEPRWGDYPAHAAAAGVRSSFSVPLSLEGSTDGVLNLYAAQPDAFTEDPVRAATEVAAGAAGAIAMTLRLAAQVRLTEQLQTALSTRAVIDRAVGIVMRDRRCTADEAFTQLRTLSQQRNVKLRVLAGTIVDSVTRPPTPPGRSPQGR